MPTQTAVLPKGTIAQDPATRACPGRCPSFVGTDGFEQSRRERKKIEMRFAHLKRILRLDRLRLRGPRGAQDEFVLAAIAQNLRRLASLVARPTPARAVCIV
jgi:Transposase DDE domain